MLQDVIRRKMYGLLDAASSSITCKRLVRSVFGLPVRRSRRNVQAISINASGRIGRRPKAAKIARRDAGALRLRRITVLIKQEGWPVNGKRVYSLYKGSGLQLRNKAPKRKVNAKLRDDRHPASGHILSGRWTSSMTSSSTAARSISSPTSTTEIDSRRPWIPGSLARLQTCSRRSSGRASRSAIHVP
jgi:putative transposase